MMVSLFLEKGETYPTHWDARAFCWDKTALSLQFGQNHPGFPQIAGRDRLASDCQRLRAMFIDDAELGPFLDHLINDLNKEASK